ncbi:hypothetical protein K0A97_01635 [Patescibacteria group bacterium]|nr:hypothetical protein [Patescibacteria group bacterium]
MKKTKNLLTKIKDSYIRKPIRNTILLGGLVGLTLFTSIKDNVHFLPAGTMEINSPQKDQYVWGFFPFTKITGESDVSITNFSIMGENYIESNSSTGNVNAYGLIFGGNTSGDQSFVRNMNSQALIMGSNDVKNYSSVGDMKAKSLFFGLNNVKDNSIVGDMNAGGIIVGDNEVNDNSSVGDMKAKSLLLGLNRVNKGGKTLINGKITSRGLISHTPKGTSFGTRIENYIDYTH